MNDNKLQKRYEGTPEGDDYDLAGEVAVFVNNGTDGVEHWDGTPLPKCLDEVNHSPTGFAWNYGGSGPAQLGYAILRDYTGSAHTARRLHQDFKRDVIARLPRGAWVIEGDEVADWIEARPPINCDDSTIDDAGIEDGFEGQV